VNHTALITTEKKQNYPILIIDKHGLIGEALVEKLKEDSLIVLVTSLKLNFSNNVIHIPYAKKFPTIPDNIYSHIFIIDESPNFFKEVFTSFLNKAKNDKSDLITIFNLFEKEDSLIEKITEYKKAKIILYGDVFGEKTLDKNSYINKFIYQIKTVGKIDIPDNGLKTIYPVYFEDLINGILEASFTTLDNEKIVNIFPKQGITLISLVRLFQKIDPTIKINFSKTEKDEKELRVLENGIYILGDKYSLEEKLKKIDLKSEREYVEKDKKNTQPKTFKKIINFQMLILSIIIIFLLPFFSVFSFSFLGNIFLNSFEKSILQDNPGSSGLNIYLANSCFNLATTTFPLFSIEASFFKQEKMVVGMEEKIDSGSDISIMFLETNGLIDNLGKGENISQLTINLKQVVSTYEKEKSLGNISPALSSRLDNLISFASKTEESLSEIFSLNGNKNYLILFTDSNNLRPNGGVIDSYGILQFKNGKITDFSIHNIDEADSLLKLRIEPPYPLRRYVPITTWYLKDSNFDPDFSKSALSSAMIFNTEKKQKVDGVISLDLYFAKNLLSLLGPTYILDYNITIDQSNILQETTVNANTLKPNGNFLHAIFASLLNKLGNNSISGLSLFNLFLKSVDEKHLILAFNDASIQKTFSSNGFSSSLEETRNTDETKINDFVGINEANLGNNDANNSITRSVTQSVTINNDKSLNSTLNITYKNNSENTGDDYKNYLRVILPKGSKITSITINGQSQKIIPAVTDPAVYENKNFVAALGLEVNMEEEQGKNIFGFLVNIPIKQEKTIQISYQNSLSAPLNLEEFTYSLRLFKQPGIDSYPFNLTVLYPQTFNFVNSDDFKLQNNQAIHNETFSNDKDLNLVLGKKS
jgi:hypothetical protein